MKLVLLKPYYYLLLTCFALMVSCSNEDNENHDTDTNSNSDGDADSDTDSDTDGDADSDTDTDSDTDGDTDSDTDSETYEEFDTGTGYDPDCPDYPEGPYAWNEVGGVVPPDIYQGLPKNFDLHQIWCDKSIKSIVYAGTRIG